MPKSPEEPAVRLGPRFPDAVAYAAIAHAAQATKIGKAPYMAHLLGTCSIALEHGADEDTAIAAVLHDVAEDQGGQPRLADVEARFGPRVARIVEACSDTLSAEKEPWVPRKQAYLGRLAGEPYGVVLVSASDKLYNVRATVDLLRDEGDAAWPRFSKAGKWLNRWYFRSVLQACRAPRQAAMPAGLDRLLGTLERSVEDIENASGMHGPAFSGYCSWARTEDGTFRTEREASGWLENHQRDCRRDGAAHGLLVCAR